MNTISIDELIRLLQEEKANGATTVHYKGTVMTDNGNSIVLTTVQQF